ncbi:MAG: Mpo1-like protein [Moraxella osloensis]
MPWACLESCFAWQRLLSCHLGLSFGLLHLEAWIGQFVGHKIEGKKPSFFEDLQFCYWSCLMQIRWAKNWQNLNVIKNFIFTKKTQHITAAIS